MDGKLFKKLNIIFDKSYQYIYIYYIYYNIYNIL